MIAPKSNDEFLQAVFTGLHEPHRPFVLGFEGKPKDRKAWGGSPWLIGETSSEDATQNWYFTLAMYSPNNGYHRQEKHCAGIFGVMLDDLGTKALPLDRLASCPPSIVVETSPGNFQASYLFNTIETDLARVKALNQSMVEAGLCDPGAKSPPTRWGRLPFGINGKTDPPFQCRLVDFHPERRYTVDAILEGLDLVLPAEARKKLLSHKAAAAARNADGVLVPRPEENEVVAVLKKRGLYKQPLGSGKHDMTCPWVLEHTDQVDGGAAYFEPSDLFPIGGFKCQHSHSDKYRIGALLEFLGVTFQAAKHRPTIKVEPGELHRIVDAAEAVLTESGRYYQRGGLIVSVNTAPESGATTIRPVSQPALVRALSGCASWLRYDARAADFITSDPPARHVQVLFDSERFEHLPALTGIARQPHLRADGSLVRAAGFDSATGLFGVFDERQFNIPEIPSRKQAQQALAQLRGLLTEFDFASPTDEAAALAGILTAVIRPSLPSAPMFHIKAPQIASGKSYLSSIISAFAGPGTPSAVGFPASDEECQKQLLALLMEAPSVIVFDNLTSDLVPYKSLCSALTEGSLTGRILGVSKTATVGTRALFLSSGNNVIPVKDMARRCITVALDPQVETPAARNFRGDPLAAVRAERPRFAALALTIIRASIVSGEAQVSCRPLASYSQWAAWVRQPLLWLGLPDPAERVFKQLAQDPDRETLGRLLTGWHRAHGKRPVMIREAVTSAETGFCDEAKNLRECLLEVAEERGEINRRRLGRWIARHEGRIVDGMRFVRASGTTSAERWMVESVSVVSQVSLSSPAQSVTHYESDDDEPIEVLL